MILKEVMHHFGDKNVLLLQGPVGPFFYKLSKILKENNAKVFKINFTGGDFLFYPFNAISYKDSLENLRNFIYEFCLKNNIQIVFAFNDCRPIHKESIKALKQLGIDYYIFEEGYIRPNFITFEKDGVNANSKLPKEKSFYLQYKPTPYEKKEYPKSYFGSMAWISFYYWAMSFILGFYFNNALHHRSLSPMEMFPWFLSLYRKYYYKLKERSCIKKIKESKKRYFALILQVYNDTQIKNHFDGKRIERFIKRSIISFARYSNPKDILVIKHHPMDRGYKDYHHIINRIAIKCQIKDRILYIHDIHLPTFLSNATGCVVINSTTGLSSILHNCPTKVCGNAIYDIDGLTYQGSLDLFWKKARKISINKKLYKNFRGYLIDKIQIEGNFYS